MSHHRFYNAGYDYTKEGCEDRVLEMVTGGVFEIAVANGYSCEGELPPTYENFDAFQGDPSGTLAAEQYKEDIERGLQPDRPDSADQHAQFGCETPQCIVPDHKAREMADALERYIAATSCEDCATRRRNKVSREAEFCRRGSFFYTVS